MYDLLITADTMQTITVATGKQMQTLRREMAAAFPEAPNAAFAAAIGAAVSITLLSFNDPEQRAGAVEAINDMLKLSRQEWRLMPLA